MPLKPKSFIPALIDQIFSRHSKRFDEERRNNTFTKKSYTELLSELEPIFGNILKLALRILDEQTITLYTTNKDLCEIAEITEGRNAPRVVKLFSHINYCPCSYFLNNVLRVPSNTHSDTPTSAPGDIGGYTCQHVLAVRLAKLLQASCVRKEVVPNHTFTFLLKQINSDDGTKNYNILETLAAHMY